MSSTFGIEGKRSRGFSSSGSCSKASNQLASISPCGYKTTNNNKAGGKSSFNRLCLIIYIQQSRQERSSSSSDCSHTLVDCPDKSVEAWGRWVGFLVRQAVARGTSASHSWLVRTRAGQGPLTISKQIPDEYSFACPVLCGYWEGAVYSAYSSFLISISCNEVYFFTRIVTFASAAAFWQQSSLQQSWSLHLLSLLLLQCKAL